jgi:uncharacterized protein
MRKKSDIIFQNLSSLLRSNLQDNLIDLVLFGSQISGKSHQNSDYDILIILKQKADWETERRISDLCYEIDLKFNILIDSLIISEPELLSLRGKQPVIVNALTNGLHI